MEKKVKFAFVSNIIEDKDVRLKVFYPILGYLIPLFIWRWIFIIRAKTGKGFSCVAQYNVFSEVIGYTVLVEMTAKQLVSKRHLKLGKETILKACLYAQNELGVDVIGLGSLTKSVTGEGRYLLQHGVNIGITHGDAYTVASGVDGVRRMIKQFKIDNPVIAVIGAYGKIGRAMCLLLSKKYKVVAMGRRINSLKKLQAEGGSAFTVTTSLKDALSQSSVAVMATSAPYSIINKEVLELNRAYYLYDIGQPNNLLPDKYWRLIKNGYNIIRADGGFEKVNKKLDINFWMRLDYGVMYACYVESVTQALAKDFNCYVGPVQLNHVAVTKQRAEEFGFEHLPPSCYGLPLKEVIGRAVKVKKENNGARPYSKYANELARIAAML